MRVTRRGWLVAALVAGVMPWLAGCHSLPTGPSLGAVSIAPPTLRATTGNRGLCCCRIVSVATNHTEVAVDLTIKFAAVNPLQREAFASVVYFVADLRPGQSSAIDAPGFIVPCDAIDHVLYELEVRGLTSPAT